MASEAILLIYSSIQSEVCKNILFEKVLELIYDPNLEVKAQTIKMVVDLLDYIHKQEQREKIANLFSELITNVNDEVIVAVSSKLSQLIQKLGDIVLKNNAHLTGIMNFFKEISKNKNDDIRCYFLFNLPALNKLVDKNIYFNYRHVFLEFARSKNEKIRYYWVEILEDMIEFMPEEDRLNLVKPLLDGLYECETDGAILELLLAKWVAFFKCFYAHEEENSLVKLPHNPKNPVKVRPLFNQVKEKKSKFMSIARIMAAKIKNLNKWRLMKEFIIKLDEITKVEYINGFLPDILEILVECIKRSVEEVRREAVKLYCRVIIHLPKFDQRKTAVKIFYDELIKEATFHNKLSFLLFVEESMKVFSKPALRYYVLPQALMYYNEKAVSLKINLIRLMPDLIDAIDPKDEVINKKFQTMKKSFEDMNVKQIKEALIEATNKIQLRMRSKVYQIEVAKRYKENRELEESLLSTQYEDVSLEEIYKKEGNVTGKGSTATKMLKTIPTKVPVMKKLASQDIKEEKDEPKGVSSTGKPLISNLTNSKNITQSTIKPTPSPTIGTIGKPITKPTPSTSKK